MDMNLIYDKPYKITYYDLDCEGLLKMSALLRLINVAAEQNANTLNVGFTQLEPLSMAFVLQRFGLDIRQTPVYGQTVRVRTWPGSIARGTFTRFGELWDENEKKMADWVSLWVLLDLKARKILRPSALPQPLPEMGSMGVTAEAQKIDYPETWGEDYAAYRHTVRYSEVDTNKHMNNTFYGDLIANVLHLPGMDNDLKSWSHTRTQINYLNETRLGDEIDVCARRLEDTFWITGTASEKTAFSATVSKI